MKSIYAKALMIGFWILLPINSAYAQISCEEAEKNYLWLSYKAQILQEAVDSFDFFGKKAEIEETFRLATMWCKDGDTQCYIEAELQRDERLQRLGREQVELDMDAEAASNGAIRAEYELYSCI